VSESDEIDDIRTLETSGKRLESKKLTTAQRKRALKLLRRAFQVGDERTYLDIIRRDFGLKDGSPEFLRAYEAWRSYRKNR
jgi:hypothetical protein